MIKKNSSEFTPTENDLLDFKAALKNAINKFKQQKPSFEKFKNKELKSWMEG